MPRKIGKTALGGKADYSPQPIKDAEIMYADVAESRLSALAKIIGGVIRPASIARACWRPLAAARRMGSSESSA